MRLSNIPKYAKNIPSNITKIKTIKLFGGTDSMVKYKISYIFNDSNKSLNRLIAEVLKIEIQKKLNMPYNYLDRELPLESTHYSQMEGE